MKAKCKQEYESLATGAVGDFVEDDSWQGVYVGRKKPYGYFEFETSSGHMKLSVKLVKESPNFKINED